MKGIKFRKFINKLYVIKRKMKYKPKVKLGYRKDDPFDPKKHGQDFVNTTRKD